MHLLNDTVMERDRRLTGFMRGQTDRAAAPPGFELNNPWRVCAPNANDGHQLTCNSASSDSSKHGTMSYTHADIPNQLFTSQPSL
jgi:hypothetical protein